jgi:hypothetical protein
MNTQNTELAKVKARIKALSNKTIDRGCSEHEAEQAMAMVGRLLAQYNLTMSEIDVREAVCTTIRIPAPKNHTVINGCVTGLGDLFGAKVWYSTGRDEKRKKVRTYNFFGTEDDLEMISYLFRVIQQSVETETEIFKTTETYRYTTLRDLETGEIRTVNRSAGAKVSALTSFHHGMKQRIYYRLTQLKKQMTEEVAAAADGVRVQEAYEYEEEGEVRTATRTGKTGTALVFLKGQLVEAEYKKLGMKIRTVYSRARVRDGSAYSKGSAAGDRVNLSRPISGGSKSGGYLT